MLHAYALVLKDSRKVELRDLIRAAYMWRFGKDISPSALDADLELFRKCQVLKKYFIDYLISTL
jgi:hypothetical protein